MPKIEIARENEEYKEIEDGWVALDSVRFQNAPEQFEVYVNDEYEDAEIFDDFDEAVKYFNTF